ncbi:Nif11-like leader peptide family natural product precursor [Rhodobacteraceae bacterium B1Z28]|uniref:Nif11-like leader peptide family natural product n=1 Tax=Ruegeria haliotis TaxID=2747601 RepID=A0ABX2PZ41_9RHOB|nr:Nif11-like leader peptide family RiPP precursor [Ruegeria haliotis]NVO58337.1 Nif11-like leader peptide family natural product precursor [Ruegeria haliotis]
MSVENLKEYARRCAADPELRAKAKEIGATDLDGQIAHAASMGLNWTREDMGAFQEELQADGELSEDDLEKVAGGVVTTTAAAAAVAVATASAAVATAATAVTSTTSGSGW